MFKVMIETLDSNGGAFCIKTDIESSGAAWDWWDNHSDDYPEMLGVYVADVTGTEEFFQGWDTQEINDAWDGYS